MSEALVIRLAGRAPDSAQWMLVDTSGSRLGAVTEGALAEAAGMARSRYVVVLVPGEDVLLAEPELPPVKGGARLAQIVPFALEEQLAGDIDAQHFAVGRRGARNGTPVAVIAHERLRQWLDALAAAGIVANALYAETDCVPFSDGLVLLIDKGRVYARRAHELPVLLDVEPLSEALQLAIASDLPLPVTIYISEAEYDAEQTLLQTLRERADSLQIKLLPEGVLPLLAVQAASHKGVNLLQGPYGAKTSLAGALAPWRYAALLAGILFGLLLITQGVQLWQLRREEAQLDQAINALYSQAMPGAPGVAAAEARKQFEARLLAAQAGGQGSKLLEGLSTVGEALRRTPDTRIDSVAFRSDTLDLRVLAPNIDALDQIRQVAQSRGASANIQAANPRDNKIEGRLQLKTGA